MEKDYIKIKRKFLLPNKYNPKKPFSEIEKKALIESIKKNDFIGAFIVIPDFKKPGYYIVFDGNDRVKLFGPEDEIPCTIYTKCKTESQLKLLTAEYVSIGKKINKSDLYKLFQAEKSKAFIDLIGGKFKIVTEKVKEQIAEVKIPKTAIVIFRDNESYEIYKALCGSFKKKLTEKSKIWKVLESKIANIDYTIEQNIFNILGVKE